MSKCITAFLTELRAKALLQLKKYLQIELSGDLFPPIFSVLILVAFVFSKLFRIFQYQTPPLLRLL